MGAGHSVSQGQRGNLRRSLFAKLSKQKPGTSGSLPVDVQLGGIFNELDPVGTGCIARQDVHNAAKRLGYDLDEATLQQLMDMFASPQGSDAIDHKQFTQYVAAAPEHEPAPAQPAPAGSGSSSGELFCDASFPASKMSVWQGGVPPTDGSPVVVPIWRRPFEFCTTKPDNTTTAASQPPAPIQAEQGGTAPPPARRFTPRPELETALPVLFAVDPSPGDAIEGALGDCFFIAAVSVLCQQPRLIRQLFVEQELQPSGRQRVRLFQVGGVCMRFRMQGSVVCEVLHVMVCMCRYIRLRCFRCTRRVLYSVLLTVWCAARTLPRPGHTRLTRRTGVGM
jgi:hypothetical protein